MSAPLLRFIACGSVDDGKSTLIDPPTFDTVGAGMIEFPLRRAANVHWQALSVSRTGRAEMKRQRACCVWITWLRASGKSSIASGLEQRLFAAAGTRISSTATTSGTG